MLNNGNIRPLIVVDEGMMDTFRARLIADIVQAVEDRAETTRQKDIRIERHAAASRLGKHPSTLARYEKAGLLRAIKIGRTVYYPESELINLEEGRHVDKR